MAELPFWYWALFGALISSSVASFLGVVVERLPRRERLGGRSHCACGRQLTALENIPVIGWLRCGGRTRCCQTSLPRWYVLSEALSLLAGALAGAALGPAGIGLVATLQLVMTGMLLWRKRSH